MEKTNSGFEAICAYHNHCGEEYLERALESFQCALVRSGSDPACRATALFGLATSKFIKCQAYGTYSELDVPIELYGDALKLRGAGHPDRPATLLLLAQALLSRLGQVYDESIATQIGRLLVEIHFDDSRNRRTADVIARTCRFYRAVNSENPAEVDSLFFRNLDLVAYVPPYGCFDRPHLLHKLSIAFWARFKLHNNPSDLDKSIELGNEALQLIANGHNNRASMVACLGRSFLSRLELLGDPTDIDILANLEELGEQVVTALNNMPSTEGDEVSSEKEKLREQIMLMLATDTVVQFIEQEVSLPRIPAIQNLIDEWSKEGGISARCKRLLGTLLSFLGGKLETKMRELLANMDWDFKEYKTKETVQDLQHYMLHFEHSFKTMLGIELASRVLIHGSANDPLAISIKVCSSRQSRARC